MSAEIQTSLFILTAEIAAVTSVAALVAAGLAWARGRARLKAAEALRDAAARLPGEGEVVQKERELLGEFARAYLTRDAERLAGLPARLLSLRQVIEAAAAPAAPEEDLTQDQVIQALEAERAGLQAKVEGLEQQRMQTQQHLDTALATINTLVQEYGRGRGQEITPTAEALLQALLQAGGVGMAAAAVSRIEPAHAAEPLAPPDGPPPAAKPEGDEALLDLAVADDVVVGTEPEPAATAAPAAEAAGSEPVAAADIDALLEDVLGTAASVAPAPAPHADELVVEPQAPVPAAAKEGYDQGLDLSVPVEPVVETAAVAEPAGDELDALDIDALLDAELGRQARLLTPVEAPGEEQYDLARVDEPGTKK
ncbi:hypothetical protein [Thiofaba sp. EF100]|uniref:hypothetical protein n=1 Tax=Thiofaba sp. EF100 TaxID=3121274 RepID=UPI003221B419